MWQYTYTDELYHYGIPGMKWGHRKVQPFSVKATGHRMAAKLYGINERKYRTASPVLSRMNNTAKNQQLKKAEAAQQVVNLKSKQRQDYRQAKKDYRQTEVYKAKRAKAIKVGASAAGVALATYGGYKLNQYVKTKNCQIAAQKGFEAATKSFNNQTKLAAKAFSEASKNGGIGYRNVNVDVGASARKYAENAANDNFRTAARNVINYKRQNGGLSLHSVDYYKNIGNLTSGFDNRKRRG